MRTVLAMRVGTLRDCSRVRKQRDKSRGSSETGIRGRRRDDRNVKKSMRLLFWPIDVLCESVALHVKKSTDRKAEESLRRTPVARKSGQYTASYGSPMLAFRTDSRSLCTFRDRTYKSIKQLKNS